MLNNKKGAYNDKGSLRGFGQMFKGNLFSNWTEIAILVNQVIEQKPLTGEMTFPILFSWKHYFSLNTWLWYLFFLFALWYRHGKSTLKYLYSVLCNVTFTKFWKLLMCFFEMNIHGTIIYWYMKILYFKFFKSQKCGNVNIFIFPEIVFYNLKDF